MGKRLKAEGAEELFLDPGLAAWLPEADWEWRDRVHTNLWPCERCPKKREGTTPPRAPAGIREDEP